jgi:Cu2+-exporting ATPase
VVQEWYAGDDSDATKSLLFGLIGGIKHPVSVGVADHLKAQATTPAAVSDVKSLTGTGVQGIAKESGLALQVGNSRWLNLASDPAVQTGLSSGYTVLCFTIDGNLAAVFSLEDSVRPDAAATVKDLIDRGMEVHVISGDDDGAVRTIANQLSIPASNVRSRCTPGDKQAYIQALLKPATAPNTKKPKDPVVIFCGDGTNDAVALAQATVGIHMSDGGTDVASAAADVVLVRPSLAGVLTVVSVSRASMRRVAFNFGWSFLYNLLAVLLAAGAFVRARIPPEFAGLGEIVSVLPVIAAAVLMRWSKI